MQPSVTLEPFPFYHKHAVMGSHRNVYLVHAQKETCVHFQLLYFLFLISNVLIASVTCHGTVDMNLISNSNGSFLHTALRTCLSLHGAPSVSALLPWSELNGQMTNALAYRVPICIWVESNKHGLMPF